MAFGYMYLYLYLRRFLFLPFDGIVDTLAGRDVGSGNLTFGICSPTCVLIGSLSSVRGRIWECEDRLMFIRDIVGGGVALR